MSALISLQPQIAAVRALVDAAATPWRSFDYGDVPGLDGNSGTTPRIHALLSASRISYAPLHSSRLSSVTLWRVSVRCVGRTANESAWLLDRVSAALDGARVTVSGRESTPLVHDGTDEPRPDDGWHSALVQFTYSI